MRCALFLVVLAACSDDITVTRLPGAPAATRALTVSDDGAAIVIGGDSEFGLAYLQKPGDGDAWIRADNVPAFDANARLLRGASDIFAISETAVHRWDRAAGAFAWSTIAIPMGVTPNTAFAVDDTGHIFALELQPDGAGAVWSWRTDTNRWEEVAMTRPIGVGAARFVVSDSGNSVAWVVPGIGIVRVDRIANTRSEVSCEAPELGGCGATIQALAMHGDDLVTALVCGADPDGTRTLVGISSTGLHVGPEIRDAGCRAMSQSSDGTTLVVADGLHVARGKDDIPVRIADADPDLAYLLADPSTAFAFGNGVYKLDF